MFRVKKTRPSSGALFDCIYSFWYNAPILLLAGDKVVTGRQQCRCIVPKAVYRLYGQKVLPKMGEFVARNMYSRFKQINKKKDQ